jgi:hypothetical protein
MLSASGKTGVMSCPRLETRGDVLRVFPLLLKSKAICLLLHNFFCAQEITFTFELHERPVLRIGHLSAPGPVARLLGLYPVELKTLQLCKAIIQSMRTGS